jgi:hypothetical protein
MEKRKYVIVIIVLLTVIVVSYTVPPAKYIGTHFISELDVPLTFDGWSGKNVSEELNINAANTNFNFINESLAHQYFNSTGKSLIFILLDAGNFHHPKVCFTGAGYTIKELPDTEFVVSDRSFMAHTLFTKRGGKSFLSFYWIVIDKNIAHKWIEQKLKQLYFSMLNKSRVGLMVRMDIPTDYENIGRATTLAKRFINDLSLHVQSKYEGYLFGE